MSTAANPASTSDQPSQRVGVGQPGSRSTRGSDSVAGTRGSDSVAGTRGSDSVAGTRGSDSVAGRSAEPERIDRAIGRMDAILRQHEDMVHRQQQAYGGVQFGSALFGWLTATGVVLLLAALAAAVGLAMGGAQGITVRDAMNSQPIASATVATALGLILVGYLGGGYVAGRMARFQGGRQGVGVWLWAVAISLVVVAAGLIAGDQFDVAGRLKNVPRPTLVPGTQVATGIALVAAMLVISLIGAVLGGLAGMRFHRRVDRVELERAELDRTGSDREAEQPQASR